MSPVGAVFVPSPLKTGANLLHPLPPPIVERLNQVGSVNRCRIIEGFVIISDH